MHATKGDGRLSSFRALSMFILDFTAWAPQSFARDDRVSAYCWVWYIVCSI